MRYYFTLKITNSFFGDGLAGCFSVRTTNSRFILVIFVLDEKLWSPNKIIVALDVVWG